MLAELEKTGTIHMSLVYRGERKTAEKFLKAQDEVLNPPQEENTAENAAEGGEVQNAQ